MSTFIVVFLFMGCILLMMAVGVLFAKKPIKGSCGGMSALGMDTACDICGGDKDRCEKESAKAANEANVRTSLFKDAMVDSKMQNDQ